MHVGETIECVLSVDRGRDRVTLLDQEISQRIPHDGVVVHHEDRRSGHGEGSVPSSPDACRMSASPDRPRSRRTRRRSSS